MAVQVADTMKAKNNLDFPVVESQDIKGGVHCVATIAERDALLETSKIEAGMLVYVATVEEEGATVGKTYQLNNDLLTFSPFGGEITETQMTDILTYVSDNMETSKVTEEDGVTYLELI